MTADRWWVRWGARWLARVEGVAGQLRLAMLTMTGLSTATLTLRQYGHGEYAWPLIAITALLMLVYTYLFNEGGVRNQAARDNTDLSTNYSGPTMYMDDIIIGAAVFAAMHGRPPNDEELEIIEEAVESPWTDFREGIEIDEEHR